MVFRREIEKKYVVQGSSFEEAHNYLSTFAKVNVVATSFDLYWRAYGVDFVRLRDNSREVTVKVTDKGTVTNRIEENVRIFVQDMATCKRFLSLLFGSPVLKITKKFGVYEFSANPSPGVFHKVVLCLYQVEEDIENRLFFEIEADSMIMVNYTRKQVALDLKSENRSLFQIFEPSTTDPKAA